MKQHRIVLRSLTFIFLLSFAGLKGFAQSGDMAPLPGFSFLSITSRTITPEDLEKGMPVIVFYYDPDCDHCQKQASLVAEKADQFENVNMVWVSWGEIDAIKEFGKQYFYKNGNLIVNQSRTFFLKDTEYVMDELFGYCEVPTIFVYDKNWKRVDKFSEETDVEALLKSIK